MLRRHQHDTAGHKLAAMYRDHATAAYRYAVHLTGSQHDAEDLVQAAFLEAHRFLGRGGAIVNPRAWLATVVRTRSTNLRRDRREAAASDQLETLAGALREDTTGDAREELDRVRAALYELPESQHQAFVLRYWSDLSYREIAAVLQTTESAVESLLVRARAAIVTGQGVPADCLDVRRHLSADGLSTPAHLRHMGECARCRAAKQRLARAIGIAAAVALVPRIHVAQALAATVPGFTTAAATGTAATVGVGGTSLAAGKAGLAAKAAIAALAFAGSAALVQHHVHPHAGATASETRSSSPVLTAGVHPSAATAASAGHTTAADTPTATDTPAATARPRRHHKAGRDSGGSTDDGTGTADGESPTQAPGDQDGASDGDTQGQDPPSGDSQGGSSDSGETDSQGSGGTQNGSSHDGASSNGGAGNDDSQ